MYHAERGDLNICSYMPLRGEAMRHYFKHRYCKIPFDGLTCQREVRECAGLLCFNA